MADLKEKAFAEAIPNVPPIPAGKVRVWKKVHRPEWPEAWIDLDPKNEKQAKMIEFYKTKAANSASRVSKVESGKPAKVENA